MTPLEAFLIAALTGLGGYSAWVTRSYIAHLLSDIAGLSHAAQRGTALAEKGADGLDQQA